MPSTSVSLPAPLDSYAQAQVAAGRSASVDDFIEALIRADAQEQALGEMLSGSPRLARLIDESFDEGEGRLWSGVILDELKGRVESRS